MKKVFSILLALGTLLCFSSCGGETMTPVPSYNDSSIYEGVAPLSGETDLVIAQTGSYYDIINTIIYEKGGFDEAGIRIVDWIGYSDVTAMLNNSDKWDIGIYGIEGTFQGVLKDIKLVGAAARDVDSLAIYAKDDSTIVKAGKANVSGAKALYGTKTTWKKAAVALDTSTNLRYLLGAGLGLLDLEIDDVTLTNKTSDEAKSALSSGDAVAAGIAGDASGYTKVMDAEDLGLTIAHFMAATSRALNDENKAKAISKWIELYERTVDWIYANEDNFNEAGDIWVKWNEEEGKTVTKNESLIEIATLGNRFFTAKENNSLFTSKQKVDSKELLKIEALYYAYLTYDHACGKNKNITVDMLTDGVFDGQFVAAAYGQYQGEKDTYYDDDFDFAAWIK